MAFSWNGVLKLILVAPLLLKNKFFWSGVTAETLVWETVDGLSLYQLDTDFLVNTYRTDFQYATHVAALMANNFAVTWMDTTPSGSSSKVKFQLFNDMAAKVDGEKLVGDNDTYSQFPDIAKLTSGFVVVWNANQSAASSYNVYGQRYNVEGNAVGSEFQVNTYTENIQSGNRVIGLADDSFVVAWNSQEQDGNASGVYMQKFDSSATKVGSEVPVNQFASGDEELSSMAPLTSGGFVIVWTSRRNVYAQLFTSDGEKIGTEFQASTQNSGYPDSTTVAGLDNGGFVVAWSADDGSDYFVMARIFNSGGEPVGNSFLVNTYESGVQAYPSAATLPSGFVVAWHDSVQDGNEYGIYAQVFMNDGSKVGPEFKVNTLTIGEQSRPSVSGFLESGDLYGGFVVVWESYAGEEAYDVYGQQFRLEQAYTSTEEVTTEQPATTMEEMTTTMEEITTTMKETTSTVGETTMGETTMGETTTVEEMTTTREEMTTTMVEPTPTAEETSTTSTTSSTSSSTTEIEATESLSTTGEDANGTKGISLSILIGVVLLSCMSVFITI